jgi:hypothetical protein
MQFFLIARDLILNKSKQVVLLLWKWSEFLYRGLQTSDMSTQKSGGWGKFKGMLWNCKEVYLEKPIQWYLL